MKTQQEQQRHFEDEEVDLSFIYQKLYNAFRRLGNAISYVFRVAIRRMYIIIGFVVVGMGLAYFAYKTTKPYYSSTMTLVLAEIRNEFVDDQLGKLVEMIKDDNYAEISKRLDISEESAKQIKGMMFSNLDEERISEDSVLTGSPFRIELLLYDNSLFSTMEPALSSYLENNRYFSKQKLIKQRQVESIISKLKDEIQSIDSLKTTVSNPRGPVNGFVYGEPIDPTNLYRESIGMYKEQANLEAELERMDNIQVVTGFSPRSRPTGPNLLKFLIIGGGIFFFFGLIFALWKDKSSHQV